MDKKIHKIINYFIVTVWIANGLFCKLLNLAPRHEQIVSRILGHEYAGGFTKAIGIAEILLAGWILSGIKSRFSSIVQIIVVAMMNILEFFLVPDLLLWGKWNIFFAFLFILMIYCNEFKLKRKES